MTGLAVLAALPGAGCRMVSPVLFETPSAHARGEALPLAVGVRELEKVGTQRITDVTTYGTFGIIAFSARMPRRSEADYMGNALANALRSSGAFTYVYGTPFDTKDVDVVLGLRAERCRIENNTLYGTAVNHASMIPTIGTFIEIGVLVGLIPQEYFTMDWSLVCTVATPEGKVIKEYKHVCSDADWVNLWSQPYANYMWYDSIFLRHFEEAVQSFLKSIDTDRAEILRAAGKA